MNKPKKAAEMYEMDQGYTSAINRENRRRYGLMKLRKEVRVKKKRWYHKVWEEVKALFTKKDEAAEKRARWKRMHEHNRRDHPKRGQHSARQFHSRRT